MCRRKFRILFKFVLYSSVLAGVYFLGRCQDLLPDVYKKLDNLEDFQEQLNRIMPKFKMVARGPINESVHLSQSKEDTSQVGKFVYRETVGTKDYAKDKLLKDVKEENVHQGITESKNGYIMEPGSQSNVSDAKGIKELRSASPLLRSDLDGVVFKLNQNYKAELDKREVQFDDFLKRLAGILENFDETRREVISREIRQRLTLSTTKTTSEQRTFPDVQLSHTAMESNKDSQSGNKTSSIKKLLAETGAKRSNQMDLKRRIAFTTHKTTNGSNLISVSQTTNSPTVRKDSNPVTRLEKQEELIARSMKESGIQYKSGFHYLKDLPLTRVFYRQGVQQGGKAIEGTVFFLHSENYDSRVWLRIGSFHLLTNDGYKVIAIDLPGYGQSNNVTELRTAFERSKFLAGLLLTLSPNEQRILVSPGKSGIYSIPLVMTIPSLLRGAVFVAPDFTAKYLPSRYEKLSLPALVVFGEDDDTNLHTSSLDSLEHLPNRKIYSLPNATHDCYVNQPDAFHRLLRKFVKRATGSQKDVLKKN